MEAAFTKFRTDHCDRRDDRGGGGDNPVGRPGLGRAGPDASRGVPAAVLEGFRGRGEAAPPPSGSARRSANRSRACAAGKGRPCGRAAQGPRGRGSAPLSSLPPKLDLGEIEARPAPQEHVVRAVGDRNGRSTRSKGVTRMAGGGTRARRPDATRVRLDVAVDPDDASSLREAGGGLGVSSGERNLPETRQEVGVPLREVGPNARVLEALLDDLLRADPVCRQRRCGPRAGRVPSVPSPAPRRAPRAPTSRPTLPLGHRRDRRSECEVRRDGSGGTHSSSARRGAAPGCPRQRDRIPDARRAAHRSLDLKDIDLPGAPESPIRLVGTPGVRRGSIRPLRPAGDEGVHRLRAGHPQRVLRLLQNRERGVEEDSASSTVDPPPKRQGQSARHVRGARGAQSGCARTLDSGPQQLYGPIALTEALQRVAQAASRSIRSGASSFRSAAARSRRIAAAAWSNDRSARCPALPRRADASCASAARPARSRASSAAHSRCVPTSSSPPPHDSSQRANVSCIAPRSARPIAS